MIPAVVPITPSAVIQTRLSHEMSLTRAMRTPSTDRTGRRPQRRERREAAPEAGSAGREA